MAAPVEMQDSSGNAWVQGMEIGVFIPIGNNGWLISTTVAAIHAELRAQQARSCCSAERYGFDFALSMIKLRGFGGKSSSGTTISKSFTLMAGLAAITSRIKLFATVAVARPCRRRSRRAWR